MTALVIGKYSSEHRACMEQAIRRGALSQVRFVADVEEGKRALSAQNGWATCIFVDLADDGVGEFVPWMRGMPQLFSVPVFGLTAQLSNQVFAHGHAKGVDDVLLDRDKEAFTRRVAILSDFGVEAKPPVAQGSVVVAHPGRDVRRLFGRTLRYAGFDPMFASDTQELLKHAASEPTPCMGVISHALPPESLQDNILQFREAAGDPLLPCIVVSRARTVRELAPDVAQLGSVEAMPETAPSDSLLFLTNELLQAVFIRGKGDDKRASARLLYGALCGFRPGGELLSVYGYSYNISADGMYVKTHDPPDRDTELWIELRPPGELTAVHLRGNVIWARLPGLTKPMTVPPGFGIRLDASCCPPGDLETYTAGYKRLLEGPRISYLPPPLPPAK